MPPLEDNTIAFFLEFAPETTGSQALEKACGHLRAGNLALASGWAKVAAAMVKAQTPASL